MIQLLLQQSTASSGVRHDPIPTAFCVFGADAEHAEGRIDIGSTEPAELLAPQCRIIGERKHNAIPDRFLARGS